MIIGAFLKYFKTYQGINYIPITDEDNLCGLVGDNGIGKSSVLEALDCFFNFSSREWNLNIATKKSGITSTKPYIVPVFLVRKNEIEDDEQEAAEFLSNLVLTIDDDDVPLANKGHLKVFKGIMARLKRNINLDEYYVLPLGEDYQGVPSVSIFNCEKLVPYVRDGSEKNILAYLTEEELKVFSPLLLKLKSLIEYIYIPREIDPEIFTRLDLSPVSRTLS